MHKLLRCDIFKAQYFYRNLNSILPELKNSTFVIVCVSIRLVIVKDLLCWMLSFLYYHEIRPSRSTHQFSSDWQKLFLLKSFQLNRWEHNINKDKNIYESESHIKIKIKYKLIKSQSDKTMYGKLILLLLLPKSLVKNKLLNLWEKRGTNINLSSIIFSKSFS